MPPGNKPDSRFEAWLTAIASEPRFCRRHQRTQLIVDRKRSGYRPISTEQRTGGYRPAESKIESAAFSFYAFQRCPACRAADAHCPPEFHETGFESFCTTSPEQEKALAVCRQFAHQVNEHGSGFALLVGRPGTGKTRLACNIVSALENHEALYARQGELTCALRASYHPKSGSRTYGVEQQSPLEAVQKAGFLVLDEVGCTVLANDERLLLDELVKYRYDHRKPTIFVSNLPLDAFKELVGDALMDRILHASGNGRFVYQFNGASYRRTGNQNYLERLP